MSKVVKKKIYGLINFTAVKLTHHFIKVAAKIFIAAGLLCKPMFSINFIPNIFQSVIDILN